MGAAVTNPQKRRRPTGGIAEAVASLLGADQWSVDRRLMQSLLVLSSSEAVRGAAAVWVQAFGAGRAQPKRRRWLALHGRRRRGHRRGDRRGARRSARGHCRWTGRRSLR